MRELDQEFQDLIAARGPALLRTAYLLTGDQQLSEDLVQTSLEKALRHWSRIKVPEAAEGYVRRIMYRENVSFWRQRRAREIPTAEPPEQCGPACPGDAVEDRLVMRGALMRLGARQRTVLVLRFYEDLTEAQVARAMGVTVGTVKSQTAKALDQLRRTAPELTPARDKEEAK
ncbi:MAG: SigE family RNA polymerase sigma factor [Mycobacteriaceae bacterium]